MNVKELAHNLGCTILTGEEGLDNKVTGGYCGDLLSWVMGRANTGDAWLTVMGNINSIAVAVLADTACIILTENAVLDEDAKNRAIQQGIPVLHSEQNSFELAVRLSELLKK